MCPDVMVYIHTYIIECDIGHIYTLYITSRQFVGLVDGIPSGAEGWGP